LSPTVFGLSVHNAVVGQWSILRGDRSEMTALACAGDGLEHALLEACAILDERAGDVLVLVGDARVPERYRGDVDDVAFDYAFALRIARQGAQRFRLRLTDAGDGAGAQTVDPLQPVRALSLHWPAWSTHCGTRRWQWTRQ
jgi:hypothetical protein